MTFTHRIVKPGYRKGTVLSEDGEVLTPPADWSFLGAGDAAVTRKVKAKGETWVVQVKRGKRIISKGIWAKTTDILSSVKEVEETRSTPAYARKREQEQARKEVNHKKYVDEFHNAVLSFLAFDHKYRKEAELIAVYVCAHATPVGSGTVARTQRITIAERAAAAVIAWMRHHTTAYDSMRIVRIQGKRREIRRLLAARSVEVLESYRSGREISADCPLRSALAAFMKN
ncbi:DUF2293 domain-containing protein [Desulfopila inferna]|uniref:DUF2293 domain-containing protein n=1 Tax=Desulfopila inferna TaxID=468528 RepID=UPI001964CFBD|nr:DUF2293 domain-containing protein [Desulfopila inferna]MBM9605900.1 DUF2293 domain-containing protein [Desulfopila inferna]